MLLHTSVNQ